jgi:hypothetical protein
MTEPTESGVEFMTKAKFSKLVEAVVRQDRLSHMEAILYLCDKHQIEPQDCKKYVSNVIKDKLEAEAMNLNYIPKGNELPT